jgi:hypothetical protein
VTNSADLEISAQWYHGKAGATDRTETPTIVEGQPGQKGSHRKDQIMTGRTRTVPALLLFATLFVSLPLVFADTKSSVKALALRTSDLPSGFTSAGSRYYSAAQVVNGTKLTESTLQGHGWITTYEVRYVRGTFKGMTNIINDVIAYKTAAGAHWGTAYAVSTITGVKRLPVTGLGDESHGFTATQAGGGQTFTVDIIAFRRGAIAVTFTTAGLKGTYTPDQVIRLARLVDRRIQHGH